MHAHHTKVLPKSWLAFDLNVLRRFNFKSISIPFSSSPTLGGYIKRWDAKVLANDTLRFLWVKNISAVANNGEKLSHEQVEIILEDAYVPGYKLSNPALATWFSETDSWWFDNVRRNIERLDSQMSQCIASSIAISVGDYALSFKGEVRELRQPLSNAFRRLLSISTATYDNGHDNTCTNKPADDFVAETSADLMLLRVPTAHAQETKIYLGRAAWAEEWLRGGNDFWEEFDSKNSGRLGAATETKSQYLHLLEETLRRASHIRNWAIAHVETGFITTQDIADTISQIRRVDTIYTKDFSELTGAKAVIITA
jgi:hypothetical protein